MVHIIPINTPDEEEVPTLIVPYYYKYNYKYYSCQLVSIYGIFIHSIYNSGYSIPTYIWTLW